MKSDTTALRHPRRREALQLGRPQDEGIRLVFDHSPRVSWRFTEIGDDAVLRRRGIYLSLRDALDPQVGASVTEATPCGEALDRLSLDLDDRHAQPSRISSFLGQLERAVCLDAHPKTETPSI